VHAFHEPPDPRRDREHDHACGNRDGPDDPEIVVANAESSSPHQELVEDLLAIVHVFLMPAVWGCAATRTG
jgi:hypothetical protein